METNKNQPTESQLKCCKYIVNNLDFISYHESNGSYIVLIGKEKYSINTKKEAYNFINKYINESRTAYKEKIKERYKETRKSNPTGDYNMRYNKYYSQDELESDFGMCFGH